MDTIKILEIHEDKAVLDLGQGAVTMEFSPVEYQHLSPLHAFILGMAYATFHNRGIQPPSPTTPNKGDIVASKTEVI